MGWRQIERSDRDLAALENLGGWFLGANEPLPGELLIATANSGFGALWLLCPRDRPGAHGVGQSTDALWQRAMFVADAQTPVQLLYRRLSEDVRVLELKATQVRRKNGHEPTPFVSGVSVGLAFALSGISLSLDLPLPTDFVAIAQLGSPTGSIAPVTGLEAKAASIALTAPGVRRVIVAKDQPGVAEALEVAARVGRTLHFVGVGTVREALAQVFEVKVDALADRLMERVTEELPCELVTEHLYWTLLKARRRAVWQPVRNAVDWLVRQPATCRETLAIVQNIVDRHIGNRGVLELDLPSVVEGTLDGTAAYYAHVVQQCADVGSPNPVEVVKRVTEFLGSVGGSLPSANTIRGALAHLLLLRDDRVAAAAVAAEALRIWYSRGLADEAAHCVSTLYRIAAQTPGDPDAWTKAERAFRWMHRRCIRNPWLTYHRARAQLLRGNPKSALGVFVELFDCPTTQGSLAPLAGRWLARALDAIQHPDAARSVRTQVRDHAWPNADDTQHVVELARILCDLDQAIFDGASTSDALQRLGEHDPAIVGHLSVGRPVTGEAWPGYLADAFPY